MERFNINHNIAVNINHNIAGNINHNIAVNMNQNIAVNINHVAVPRQSYLSVAQANIGCNPGSYVLLDTVGFTIVGRNGRPVKSVTTLQSAKKKSPKQVMVGSST